MSDDARQYNATYALDFAARMYAAVQKITNEDGVAYAESIVQYHLRGESVPDDGLHCRQLERLIEKCNICLDIVANSVGIEVRWKKIEEYKFHIVHINRWLSDIDIGVLAQNLEEEYRNQALAHQRAGKCWENIAL
jgi:hypothetical protein